MDDLRARISFQRDIWDCNIICLTETWLMPSVPDTAVTPSDNFSVLRMDRTAEAGKSKGGGVCFMINPKGTAVSPAIPTRFFKTSAKDIKNTPSILVVQISVIHQLKL